METPRERPLCKQVFANPGRLTKTAKSSQIKQEMRIKREYQPSGFTGDWHICKMIMLVSKGFC